MQSDVHCMSSLLHLIDQDARQQGVFEQCAGGHPFRVLQAPREPAGHICR